MIQSRFKFQLELEMVLEAVWDLDILTISLNSIGDIELPEPDSGHIRRIIVGVTILY